MLKTRPNLEKKMGELIEDGEEIAVSDPSLGSVNFKFRLQFSKSLKFVMAEENESASDVFDSPAKTID